MVSDVTADSCGQIYTFLVQKSDTRQALYEHKDTSPRLHNGLASGGIDRLWASCYLTR